MIGRIVEAAEKYDRMIAAQLPAKGKVQILTVTDKQYENIRSYVGRDETPPEKPAQLALF